MPLALVTALEAPPATRLRLYVVLPTVAANAGLPVALPSAGTVMPSNGERTDVEAMLD